MTRNGTDDTNPNKLKSDAAGYDLLIDDRA